MSWLRHSNYVNELQGQVLEESIDSADFEKF